VPKFSSVERMPYQRAYYARLGKLKVWFGLKPISQEQVVQLLLIELANFGFVWA
jgi:hypothetical protein